MLVVTAAAALATTLQLLPEPRFAFTLLAHILKGEWFQSLASYKEALPLVALVSKAPA
jgi:hypothetical protein